MIYFFAFIACIAAIYLLFRELIPALQAKAAGRILTKGYKPRLIERATDPERFDALIRQRMQLGLAGLGVAMGMGAMLILKALARSSGY